MTWNAAARTFLLDTNDHFHARYCETKTLERLFRPNPVGEPHSAQVASLRRIARQLSELMPNAAHSSPGWAVPSPLLPVIAMGYMNRGRRIAGAKRMGVCQYEGQLFLIVDARIAEQLPPLAIGPAHDWVTWLDAAPANGQGHALWRYATPLDLHDDNPPPAGHPLHAEHVIGNLLASIGQATDAPTEELQAALQPHRTAAETPMNLQAIYPALFRRRQQ